jgi:signal transduction histidine kinase
VDLEKRRGRLLLIALLVLGGLLLPSGFALAAAEQSAAQARVDHTISAAADGEAETIEAYFERARSITLLTANNPAFRAFYAGRGTREERIAAAGSLVENVNQALGYLETLYPSSIGEACFIDQGGAENARVVRGTRALSFELSPDEKTNPFFAPTFGLSFGQVYQSLPYVSPDTGEWVVANSALIPVPDGAKKAIVHFEVTIESFRRSAAALAPGLSVQVVDATTGQIIIDSRTPQLLGAPLGLGRDPGLADVFDASASAGMATFVGDRVAYHRLARTDGNANDWYVVTRAPLEAGLLRGMDVGPAVLLLLGVLLLVVGVLGLRGSVRARRVELRKLTLEAERSKRTTEALRAAMQREQEAAERLRGLDEMKNAFLQAVSHELRTPLTSILGSARTLNLEASGEVQMAPTERADMLAGLLKSAQKLRRLLSDLLDIDRLVRGIVDVTATRVDIGMLARQVIDAMNLGARRVALDADRLIVSVDAPKVERIIENLVANALKHTPGEARIWVGVHHQDQGVLIAVDDDGDGVPDELKQALFEPFQQGPSASPHSQGTGIGLSLVKRFAELHGGKAWVEDSAHGGASFRVYLPEVAPSMQQPVLEDRDEPAIA